MGNVPGPMANQLGTDNSLFHLLLPRPGTPSPQGKMHVPPKGRQPTWDLLCKSSLVRFKVSFGDTLAAAPVPDFCVFTRLFLPIF